MAVVLKSRAFNSSNDLTAFCVAAGNNVTTVIEIIYNQDGKYVLFYV
jgi:hypothetical protein